jgi:integrase
MKRASILDFCDEFRFVSDVTRNGVQRWINQQGQKGRKTKTITRRLSELRVYWNYLISVQAAPEEDHPFEKLSVPRPAKAGKADERKPFMPEQVVALHQAAMARDDPALANLIELAMWTGARIEELCALRVENARDGILSIEDAKTPAGWREVPVHPNLEDTLGRLLQESADGYVLSGLTANKYGDRSNAVGKRFGRLKRSLGFGTDRVFHSIRRTVATLLEDAGVPENVAADILGHEKKTMTYGLYSDGTSLTTKREALAKLHHPSRG